MHEIPPVQDLLCHTTFGAMYSVYSVVNLCIFLSTFFASPNYFDFENCCIIFIRSLFVLFLKGNVYISISAYLSCWYHMSLGQVSVKTM